MRNELKNTISKRNECLILNLDDNLGEGTHWVSLFTKDNTSYYFDSYGFIPPNELQVYCSKSKTTYYNTFKIQSPGEEICGHYCVYMLYRLNNGISFSEILDELYKRNNNNSK